MKTLLSIGLCVILAACGTSSGVPDEPVIPVIPPATELLPKAIIFDGTIPADDGEAIGITVYQPELPINYTAPLIIHGHGFGLSRAKNFEGNDPVAAFLHADTTGEAAAAAWNDAYYVISFDQRGFGDSSGNITMMDPDIDGRNVSTIIDWAVENLSHLEFESAGDPVVGSVGLSYGGGYQTITSAVDSRFDAIVPSATWNELPYSLAPNGIPKAIWLDILVAAGGPTSGFAFDQDLIAAMLQAQTGTVPEDFVATLFSHSPRSFCEMNRDDGRGPSTVPAFFIQGSQDILFNMNEAVLNFECWRNSSSDSRLLVQRDGHIIPLLQESGEQILFGGDENVLCGDETFNVLQMTQDFLNFHLKGTPMTQEIPEICVAQGTDVGQTFENVPRGGVFTTVPSTSVIPGAAGQIANILTNLDPADALSLLTEVNPLDAVSILGSLASGGATDPVGAFSAALPEIVNLLPAELVSGITSSPTFVPLHTVTEDGALLGIPEVDFTIDGGGGSVSLYYGLGIQPAGGGPLRLIDDQVIPFPETGAYELPGIAEPVVTGDVIGLMIYPFHVYFLNNSILALAPTPITVEGSVELPLH